MRRRTRQAETAAPGQDSFLDVLTNIVGILIILVMFVGVRARNAPVTESGPNAATLAEMEGLARDRAAAESLRGDVLKVAARIDDLKREAEVRDRERIVLATAAAAAKHDLEVRRAALDADARAEFDLRRSLDDSRKELERLRARTEQARRTEGAAKVIENHPTPLSRAVDDHEAHFQLRAGRIVFVPMQQIAEEVKADAKTKLDKLRRLSEIVETIGPIGGFRVKYEFETREVPLELSRRTGVVGTIFSLKYLMLLPVNSEMGETIDEAMSPGSEFRRKLERFPPQRSTVTIWTYPDSFDEFRRLREELSRAGYATAARPLPFGVPISASPEGQKSAAE